MGRGFNIKSLALLTFFSFATSQSTAQAEEQAQDVNNENKTEILTENTQDTAEERVSQASQDFKSLGAIIHVGTKDLERGKTLSEMADKNKSSLDRFYVESTVEATPSENENTSIVFYINGEAQPESKPNSKAFYSAVTDYVQQQHSHGVANQENSSWDEGKTLEGVTAVIHLIDDGRSNSDVQNIISYMKQTAEEDGMPIDNVYIDYDDSSETRENHFSLFKDADVIMDKKGEPILYVSCRDFDKGLSHFYKSEDVAQTDTPQAGF